MIFLPLSAAYQSTDLMSKHLEDETMMGWQLQKELEQWLDEVDESWLGYLSTVPPTVLPCVLKSLPYDSSSYLRKSRLTNTFEGMQGHGISQ